MEQILKKININDFGQFYCENFLLKKSFRSNFANGNRLYRSERGTYKRESQETDCRNGTGVVYH
jgi:hypothetical protein